MFLCHPLQWTIFSAIARFWSTWTFKGPPLPPEWTSVDFWLTPPPPLLVHVVVECPLITWAKSILKEHFLFSYIYVFTRSDFQLDSAYLIRDDTYYENSSNILWTEMVGRKLFHPIMKKGPKFEHEVSVAGKAIFFWWLFVKI